MLGIGDDCAIYRPRGSKEDLLFTTDLFLEDVHFRRSTHGAKDAGRVAMCRSLSDIAAMGGEPRFALVSLSVPGWADDRWVRSFFESLTSAASAAGAVLAGGDLATSEKLACDVTVCGAVPRGSALRRDGARPGHAIYVSGALGGSALGLQTGAGRAWKRHVNPEPRLALGRYLRSKAGASAAMDISDGLSLDLQRLCLASGVAADITDPPVFLGASPEQALHGGEEYELVFTVPAEARIPKHYQGLALTRIGQITDGPAGLIRHNGKTLAARGHDHFQDSCQRM
ncbi:MAG: thiamine-monophosphate kinase [Bryobacterales bacterium]|nr:thiamine-monophosphate kinase [Bryobacterales bacterium]